MSLVFQPPSAEEYEVERIVRSALDPWNGQEIFNVKWVGYDESQNTWEPIENLDNAQEALTEFREQQKKAYRQLELDQIKEREKGLKEEQQKREIEETTGQSFRNLYDKPKYITSLETYPVQDEDNVKQHNSMSRRRLFKESQKQQQSTNSMVSLKKTIIETPSKLTQISNQIIENTQNKSNQDKGSQDSNNQEINQEFNSQTLSIKEHHNLRGSSGNNILTKRKAQEVPTAVYGNRIQEMSSPSKKKQLDGQQVSNILSDQLEENKEKSKKIQKTGKIKRGFINQKGEFVFELNDPSISSNNIVTIDEALKYIKGKDIAEYLLQRILIQKQQQFLQKRNTCQSK